MLENIGTKKVFTKMDLRWGYNNMRIKEGDKWKAAFTTPEGFFEPTVMFFGLTNSPATFQAMMNELLRDLINTGKVAAFIDDCYDLELKVLSDKTTLVLSNTRELDRVPSTK